MSESESEQQTIFGDRIEQEVYLETSGRVIRPWKRMVDQIAKEYKIRFTDSTMSIDVVDSSNVAMIQTELESDALEAYDAEETTLGIPGNGFGSALQHARYGKSTDDTVTVEADSRKLQTEVTREIGGSQATISERMDLIDPDSIRSEPELPELGLDAEVEISPEAFCEVMGMLETDSSSFMAVEVDGDSISFHQDQDVQARHIDLDVDVEGQVERTLFTGSYMETLANALNVGYVDNLTLRMDTEYPMMLDFEREGVYSGTMMVAPRIQS